MGGAKFPEDIAEKAEGMLLFYIIAARQPKIHHPAAELLVVVDLVICGSLLIFTEKPEHIYHSGFWWAFQLFDLVLAAGII